MTIFVVETYVVKPGKQGELISLLQRMREYKEKNPEGFKEMKSKRIFSQMFGGVSGGYVELNEFDSVADAEKYIARMDKDEEAPSEKKVRRRISFGTHVCARATFPKMVCSHDSDDNRSCCSAFDLFPKGQKSNWRSRIKR